MLKLIKLTKKHKNLLFEMMDEWTNSNETIIPGAITRTNYKYYDLYLENLEPNKTDPNLVPSSVYFLYDSSINKLIGACDIRHYLNKDLLLYGGHIGDGIRPSFRNKGYGTKLVSLALEKCKELNITEVLMTCCETNIASQKTIIKNGGKLENEISDSSGNIIQRYWINL